MIYFQNESETDTRMENKIDASIASILITNFECAISY